MTFLRFLLLLLFLATSALGRPEGLREYQLVRVVDGDTVVLSRVKDEEISVRLLGIDCLETRRTERLRKQAKELGLTEDQAYQFGQKATEFVEETLRGRTIYLETEPKFKDRYQRKLAYLWIGGVDTSDDAMLNLLLLEKGLAKQYKGNDRPFRFQEKFQQAEEQAKADEIGIWAPPAPIASPTEVAEPAPKPSPKRAPPPPPFPWRVVAVILGLAIFILGWRMK